MTDEQVWNRALAATEKLVSRLPLTEEERAVVVGMAVDRFKSTALELAKGGASRESVSAVFAAAKKFSDVYWDGVDRQGTDGSGDAGRAMFPRAAQ